MPSFKGLLHVHSSYSGDAEHSLHQLVELGRRKGYCFFGMTEHSENLDPEKTAAYVKECRRMSNAECLLIPGIEFTCAGDLHLIGFGVTRYTDSQDPLQVSRFIRDDGGVVILAHPRRYDYAVPPEVAFALDGIEVWNAGYDGRFVPDYRILRLLRSLRMQNRPLLAYGGEDFHREARTPHVHIQLTCQELREDLVLRALRQGDFVISNSHFQLGASSQQGWTALTRIVIARRLYDVTRAIRAVLGVTRG